jgi:hypothetical protein
VLVSSQRFALHTGLVFALFKIGLFRELQLTIDKVVTICLKELLYIPVSLYLTDLKGKGFGLMSLTQEQNFNRLAKPRTLWLRNLL